MINESKGTPNILREIINDNHEEMNKYISSGKTTAFFLEMDKNTYIEQTKNKRKFKCKLHIFFNFTDDIYYNGNINFEQCIDSKFEDCEINITIPKKDTNKLKVYKSLLHELTHLYELYQIKDFFEKSSWIKSRNLNTFDIIGKGINNGLIRYFRDIYYSALTHEIRANISSLEVFLFGLQSKDEEYIRRELISTSEYNRYHNISSFDPEIYINDLMNKYGLSFIIRSFNLFNKILNINININNKDDLNRYFKKWKKYFTKISKEYKSKIDSMIKDLLKDDTDSRYVLEQHDDRIFKYSDYFDDVSYNRDIILDEILKIDYLDYLK
jgi:hypothetical protein